jgi:hypothetical protein
MRYVAMISAGQFDHFVIEEDGSVGFYLYAFASNRCVEDRLQDSLAAAIEQARIDFGVPEAAWTRID